MAATTLLKYEATQIPVGATPGGPGFKFTFGDNEPPYIVVGSADHLATINHSNIESMARSLRRFLLVAQALRADADLNQPLAEQQPRTVRFDAQTARFEFS